MTGGVRRRGWVDGRPPIPPGAIENRAKRACIRQHPFSPENTYSHTAADGVRRRHCRQCRRIAAQQRRTAPKTPPPIERTRDE